MKPFAPAAEWQNSEWIIPTCNDNNDHHMYKKRRGQWSDDEHRQFLMGLEKYGRGYKSISRHCVKTRTRTQVASHAQKYFQSQKKMKMRASIKDNNNNNNNNVLNNSAPSLPTNTTTNQDYTNNNNLNPQIVDNLMMATCNSTSNCANNDLLVPSSLSDNIDDSASSSCNIMPCDEFCDLQFLPSSSVSDPSSFRMAEEDHFVPSSPHHSCDFFELWSNWSSLNNNCNQNYGNHFMPSSSSVTPASDNAVNHNLLT